MLVIILDFFKDYLRKNAKQSSSLNNTHIHVKRYIDIAGGSEPETDYVRLADARQGGLNFLYARCSPTVARMGCIASSCAFTITLHNYFVSAVNVPSIPLEYCTK